MSSKVILKLIDGLALQVAHDGMSYLQGLYKAAQACLYKLRCELPSLSRPLYECILSHGGMLSEERLRPLFVIGQSFSKRPDIHVQQTVLCGLVAGLLGLIHTKQHQPELLLS